MVPKFLALLSLIIIIPVLAQAQTTPAVTTTPTTTYELPTTTAADSGSLSPTTAPGPVIEDDGAGATVVPVGTLVAKDDPFSLDEFGDILNLGDAELPTIVARLIRVFLSLLGLVFFLMILYSGVLWLTAGGDDEKVGKARRTLINALIGLVIIFVANSLVRFLIDALTEATGANGG
ncbi:MAG: hypothetical protein UY92_C0004G0018 [Candidatus Magasanikbacteria bacterium GW2011_GWA2_56_11]|uniref:Uncharacterized protein n=1 Tax=Candidatus Magasanikbacteria bacterium GW2011_GWA2_56_11 TaxID=1619044 RepID=A0A0G2AMZ3_9BACT|nr:MAG: hypothetical protein UY92_C0004G0018 [Candidatus Magasanikbacteria bacterium GW2011_GWA2_56_11]